MSHRFSNPSRVREFIRLEAQRREWQDIPVDRRIQILEQVSEVIEQVIREPHPGPANPPILLLT